MRRKQREAWKGTLPRLAILGSFLVYAYPTPICSSPHVLLNGYNTCYWYTIVILAR